MAPEIKKGKPYDEWADIFSLGVLWAKLIYKTKFKYDIGTFNCEFPSEYPKIDEMIKKCLIPEPEDRCTL
jgi:serine/threonine protein kinase